MSDYGADKNPDLNIARSMVFDNGLMPVGDANCMQWSYDDGDFVQKYARRKDHSNVLVKIDRDTLF